MSRIGRDESVDLFEPLCIWPTSEPHRITFFLFYISDTGQYDNNNNNNNNNNNVDRMKEGRSVFKFLTGSPT